MRVRAHTAYNIWRNSFARGNLSPLAPYFQLSSNVLVPLIGWFPGQLRAGPPLSPVLIHEIMVT
jgi:hypothetical protein